MSQSAAELITRPARNWSAYQQGIFAAIREGQQAPHLVINALAGTGKSTTLEECVLITPPGSRVLVCAFNKSIADAMAARLPEDVTCKTLHSLGMQAIGKSRGSWPKVSNYYVHDLARAE